MESVTLLLLLGLSAFVFGLICSYFFLVWFQRKTFGSYLMDQYLLVKSLMTFLFFVWAVFEFISSIYVIQCSYEIEMVFEEPKNFFVLGLFIGSFLVKKPKR